MAESLRASRDNNDKHRKRQRSSDKGEMSESKSADEGRAEPIPECAVCLQTCVHPAKLPCSHIFCFLCLKGLVTQSRRCAMCRQEIPLDYLDHPQLLDLPTFAEKEAFEDGYQWFYEGRSGWWQYDERTSRELEAAYKNGQRTCELLIVGQLYIADFDAMLQLRRNDMSRRRRIKRDLASIPKKGIAGLRLDDAHTTLPDDGAVPSTSQDPDVARTGDEETQLSPQGPWRSAYDGSANPHYHPSDVYRSARAVEESDEENAHVETVGSSSEDRELIQIEDDVSDSSDSDQADLETQLRDLCLR